MAARFAVPLLAATLAGMLAAPAAAQVEVLQLPPGRPFLTRHWTSAQGLPQNTVQALAATPDGYLWIATLGGLCRFDGSKLRVFDCTLTPELRSNRIAALHAADDGSLWIGTQHDGLVRYRDGRFEHVAEVDGELRHLGQDRDGRLQVGTDRGLFALDGSRLAPRHAQTLTAATRLLRRRNGDLLAGDWRAAYRVDTPAPIRLGDAPKPQFAETRDGNLWVGSELGLFRLVGDHLEPVRPIPLLTQPVHALFAAADGALWVSTEMRLLRLQPEWLDRPDLAQVPPLGAGIRNVMQAFVEDLNGRLWLGSVHDGLRQLRPSEMIGLGPESGLAALGANSVASDGAGGQYVSTGFGLFHCREGHATLVPGMQRFGGVDALLRTDDGALWVGTHFGLARLAGDDLRLWGQAQGIPDGCLRAIHRDRAGDLWIGTQDGVRVLRSDAVLELPELTPLRRQMIDVLVEAPDGAQWIGGARNVARFDPVTRQLRLWRCGSDLPPGEVRAILPQAGPRAWVATYGGGFCRIDGDAAPRVLDRRRGLHDDSICSAVAWRDRLVVGSNRGCFTVATADLDAVVDGRLPILTCRPIAGPEGMSAECSGGIQPGALLADDAVWICSLDGIFRLDPDELQAHAADVPCHVEAVLSGEARLPPASVLQLPVGERSLTIHLSAASFDHPEELRFRWRLLGRDRDWSVPGLAREASFSQLAPGDYVFEAQATDVDQVSSRTPARIELRVPAFWWETLAFRLAAVAAAVLCGGLLLRFGARRAAGRAARLQSLVEARTVELRAAHEHLEDRVRERTAELHTALDRQQAETAERQRLERQVAQLQRMESLGLLAGGVAHDFNNLLTVVLGCGTILEQELQGQASLAELAANIRAAGERGRRLTQHLLAVASRQLVVPDRLDLGTVVGDVAPVLRTLLGESIELRLLRRAPVATVHAAVTQIEQILLNLAANARDAMPRGGLLEITVEIDPAQPSLVQLRVRDTGIGMPPEVRERAFEPFFTTRNRAAGLGLGLSTVYGITKQLGGDIRIDSEVGRGTIFTLQLPLVLPTTAGDAAPTAPTAAPAQLQARVLLVEDDAAVRAVLQRMLQRLGCRVQEADCGEAAVQWLRQDPAAVDVVLSDVVMPGLQGMALVRALRLLRPELPIVFLSGFLEGEGTYRDLVDAGLEILSKPPVAAQLAVALERARHRGRFTAPATPPPADAPASTPAR